MISPALEKLNIQQENGQNVCHVDNFQKETIHCFGFFFTVYCAILWNRLIYHPVSFQDCQQAVFDCTADDISYCKTDLVNVSLNLTC